MLIWFLKVKEFAPAGRDHLFPGNIQVVAFMYERTSMIITMNLKFGQWVEKFGDERLPAALTDQVTPRTHILMLNEESYRFRESLRRKGTIDASSVTG